MSEDTEPCKNFEFCDGMQPPQWCGEGGHSIRYLDSGGDPDLCMNCAVMFRKELVFKDDVECPICFETKKGITQPNCEHAICIECFRDCYYGKYDEPDFPYSKDIEEEYDEYDDLYNAPKSFLDKYPLIREYEEECNRRYDRQDEMISVNSRCPLCRS
jgi:predicted Zn-ribbon and HTH transcriptional regulator